MLITKIEEGKGKKYRVFGDEQFLFSLYSKELRQFSIREDDEISDDVISNILETVIYKRAKERALFLLEKRPLSVNMLKDKLLNNEYPLHIIHKVILFLEKYHYLDDLEYTRMYVTTYSERKSKKQIIGELYRKGISKEIIEEYFEENAYSEMDCFERQFKKYIRGKDLNEYTIRQKVFRYFYSKGFSSVLIESYIRDAIY